MILPNNVPDRIDFRVVSILVGCAAPQAEILSKTDSFPPTANVEILLDRPARPHKTFAILENSYGGTTEEISGRMYRPHYRPVKHKYRSVRARAIKYFK